MKRAGRVILLTLGSMALGSVCCWVAGVSDRWSESSTRLVAGLLLGLVGAPAFVYALWHPPRAKRLVQIGLLNLGAAFIIGQGLGMGGALFVAGPAFVLICVSFGSDGRKRVVERARLKNVCVSCGYDLRGNESGVCPECGVAVTR